VIYNATAYFKFQKYITDPHMPSETNFHAGSLVNRILLECSMWNEILTIFDACECITHLALQYFHLEALIRCSSQLDYRSKKIISNRFVTRNQDLHLTLLDLPWDGWLEYGVTSDTTRRSPIFDRVTHMRLKSLKYYNTPNLHYFSRLSHFCVPYCLGGRHKPKQLQPFLDLQSLEMFVIAVAEDVVEKGYWKRLEKWVRKTRETDGRVYLVESGSNFRDKWENEMRGGESIWDQAVRYTDEWERHTNMKRYMG
jgi:hypothetical protein